jgi:hypothetical protein
MVTVGEVLDAREELAYIRTYVARHEEAASEAGHGGMDDAIEDSLKVIEVLLVALCDQVRGITLDGKVREEEA